MTPKCQWEKFGDGMGWVKMGTVLRMTQGCAKQLKNPSKNGINGQTL